MRAVTVLQPYAQLIRDERKARETRTWPLPQAMVGQYLAIHAGSKADKDLMPLAEMWGYRSPRQLLPYSAIVAVVRVEMLYTTDQVAGGELYPDYEFGDFSPGRWVWQFDTIRPLAVPWHCVGHQGLWTLFEDDERAVLQAMKESSRG